jgi:hypothetical protein
MAQRKPPKRLFKNKEVVHTYQHERETKASMKHLTRDHVDVLQNIEAFLIAYAREEPSVDDRTIDEALGVLRRDKENIADAALHVKGICLYLDQVRASRADVSDAIWLGALRTVQDSVRRHSRLTPGEKGYIEFVSNYV